MKEIALKAGDTVVVARGDLQALLDALAARDYTLIGPTVRDGAIAYCEIRTVEDLPAGWEDEQDGGTYRLHRRGDGRLFGFTVGPHSWKQFLYPPVLKLWEARRNGHGFTVHRDESPQPRRAFIGVRGCELAAIGVQDQVFLHGKYVDSTYQARREGVFIVAVNCGHVVSTCFCVSMKTGPKVGKGFDIALTEILDADGHRFVAEAGTARGAEVLAAVPHRPADASDRAAAEVVSANAEQAMKRSMDTEGIRDLLYNNAEHPRWEAVANRCMTCANCTMVCPTCFCHTVEDVTDLSGSHAERWRKWDSCFTMEFSYIHGGSVRPSASARYRQWMTHKLASWIDQFGTSGCVGCGRCITWCPVGIDITEEVRAIRETDRAAEEG
ncbi:MAG: 4Fe-4S dicluster domain-containing protein [Candidatus Sumerlaeaceae bacterium]|nr:4Fe-4S dicluster domain-containing protein [Candidatus Sumerlaeaceae bacterium]